MYKIIFYIPEKFKETVKLAMFNAGAGTIGNYDRCSWEVKGVGQFRALKGSSPFIGKKEILEFVEEFRVEMVCSEEIIAEVITALKKNHPYETPAYDVTKIIEI